MIQPRPVSAIPFLRWGQSPAGRRALSIALTLVIEVLMLLLLLSLGTSRLPGVKEGRTTLISVHADEVPAEEPRRRSPRPEQRPRTSPTPRQPAPATPQPPQLPQPAAVPTPIPPPIVSTTWELTPAERHRPDRTASAAPVYGPPDVRSAASRDTERVGTAPNGEPLYAAEWYEEPSEQMMRSYLSTARGPGWGLIACRTAPGYRVEDCVPLSEYPLGSQINRSALAAAWEFRVRPPRLGGQLLVGAWVRIRIDYGMGR